MSDKESFNDSENAPIESMQWDILSNENTSDPTPTPDPGQPDSTPDDGKTTFEVHDGDTQLGVDESMITSTQAEVDPFDPPLSTPEISTETKTPLEIRDGDAQLDPSDILETAERNGGANGENTSDQVNRVE